MNFQKNLVFLIFVQFYYKSLQMHNQTLWLLPEGGKWAAISVFNLTDHCPAQLTSKHRDFLHCEHMTQVH